MATIAQSLLALYGALDQAVIGSHGDAEVQATVERYLPGSTGENTGWYAQLLGFLGDRSNRVAQGQVEEEEAPAVPDLEAALTTLQNEHGAPGGDRRERLTTVQMSRMVYAIGALSHLPGSYPPNVWAERFSRTLELAGGGNDLLGVLRRDFRRREDFSTVMQFAAQRNLVSAYVALVPLCQTQVKFVRGHLCVVLTTEFESDQVSLVELKNVIDLRNWAKCLPFFCLMTPEQTRSDGWSRVLEHVSTTCSIPWTQMVTPLKYWKGQAQGAQFPHPSAWVDYTLDDDPAPGEVGDGRMVVDEGFIRMTATVANPADYGVRVRTRKVAGFRDLEFVPAAVLACVMGYGTEGVQMLLGGVDERPADGAGWTDWSPSAAPANQPGGAPAQPTPTGGCDPSGSAVEVAVCMLNECIDDMSQQSAAIANLWATGAVPIAETMTFTANLAARLATDPWRYLERLRDANRGSGK